MEGDKPIKNMETFVSRQCRIFRNRSIDLHDKPYELWLQLINYYVRKFDYLNILPYRANKRIVYLIHKH